MSSLTGSVSAALSMAALLLCQPTGAMAQSSTGVQSVQASPQALPSLNGSGRSGANASNISNTAATSSGAASAAAPATMAPMSQPDTSAANGGNVAELQRRIAAKELAELRTVYNGSYGASLLMATNETTYYVALFERKNFWRVIKTQNDQRAEAIFSDFARQTADLASSEIQAIKLEAQRAATEQLIGLNKDRAAQIQADLAVQQSQQQEVSNRQREALAQAAALSDENRKAQDQLADLRRQLDDLQKQQNAGLPPVSSTTRHR